MSLAIIQMLVIIATIATITEFTIIVTFEQLLYSAVSVQGRTLTDI